MKANRFLALLLVLTLGLSAFVFAQETETSVTEIAAPSEIAELLERLDIIELTDTYNPDANISRVDYLEMVISAIGIDPVIIEEDRQIFFDVAADADIAPLIQTAFNLGIIKGNSDGRFCADDPITSVEALVMTIRAAGYEEVAMAEGGYYYGYVVCGDRFEITEHISVSAEDQMSYGTAAQMIYNLLNAKVVNITGDGIMPDKDATLLRDVYHVTEERGIVDANSYANIYGADRCAKGRLSVDNVTYDVADEFDGKFIGESVVYFYQQGSGSDRPKIIYMYPEDTEITTLGVEKIDAIKPDSITYYDAKGDVKKITVSPEANVLENGYKVSIPEQGYTIPKYGEIKIIKADGNNSATTVLIYAAQYGIVKSISGESIYLEADKKFSFDTSTYETVIIKNGLGEEVALEDISKLSLAEVYEAADKEWIEIIVSNNTKTIVASSIRKVGDEYAYYEITDSDGTVYATVRDFNNLYADNKATVGSTYTALFNLKGEIVAFITRVGQYRYGYVYKSINDVGIFNSNIMLKVLTETGNFEDFSLADRVKDVGTDSIFSKENIYAQCKEGSVIKFKQNPEGEITEIEFAKTDDSAEGFRVAGATPENAYNETTRYRKEAKLFGGIYALGADTVIFEIPKDKSDMDEYHVLTSDEIVDQRYYPGATGYVDNDTSIASAIVMSANPRVERDSARMLVTDIAQVWNAEEGTTETALMGFVDGKEKTIPLIGEDVLNCIVRDSSSGDNRTVVVGEGDVIRYATDLSGRVTQILLAVDCDEGVAYGQRKSGTDANGNEYSYQIAYSDKDLDWGADAIHMYGKATKMLDDTYLKFKWNGDDAERVYSYPVSGTSYIYEYDQSRNDANKASVVSVNDIITLEDNPDSTDTVAMLTRLAAVPMVVIYKK